MILFDGVSFTYPGATRPVLRQVNLEFTAGQLALVIGPTGAGKSTLLKAINGLVPHFTGGLLSGRVETCGRLTATNPPRRLAGLAGYVGQDPAAGFVADRVVDELAYTMEQRGVDPPTMRARVEEVLDLLGIAGLRGRDPASLSAGEAQRVAIAAALTPHPKVLVLDEPTSALDPAAAEDVMAAISRLVDDLDMTVVMAEHRLERVIQFADQIVRVDGDGLVTSGPPREQLVNSPVAPPLVRLGRALEWPQPPLTVREARRRVPPSSRLASPPDRTGNLGTEPSGIGQDGAGQDGPGPTGASRPRRRLDRTRRGGAAPGPGEPSGRIALRAENIRVTHPGPVEAVKGVSLELRAGQITGLMGRNGAGKTSLLWALAEDRRASPRHDLVMVPAQPTDLFWADSVTRELPNAQANALLEQLAPGIDRMAHPRDLSEGQRLALALAIQLTAETQVVILDEPTRGLDYAAKDRLADSLKSLAAQDRAVLVATHDVEFLAIAVDRILWMAEGEIVGGGPAGQFLLSVPAHAPQIAKVMAPNPCLAVDAAVAAVTEAAAVTEVAGVAGVAEEAVGDQPQ
ncbi:MAG: ATP-binding cassette domain-containing protein [Bifidobacteriaceae bacterium]|jgi:energy-coupling factor transport system ATP-binding protein|nr:ATP-binding cassette domain-containing protein [Bifidobacteriaceae bacterium]